MPTDKKRQIISSALFQEQAKKVMTPGTYAFIYGAAADEWTLKENRRAFNDFPIRTHRFQGMATKDANFNTQLLGHSFAFPMVFSPRRTNGAISRIFQEGSFT